MIIHIVLFKLKDRSRDNIEKAAGVLKGLLGKVPELRHLEVGVDAVRSRRSYDIALTAWFETLKALEAYQKHPEHVKVVKYMEEVRDEAVAVDYER